MASILRFCLSALLLITACNYYGTSTLKAQAVSFETLFGKPNPNQVIVFNGPVTPETVLIAIKQLKEANTKKYDEIIMMINSPGGNVAVGMQLSIAIENSRIPVTCVVEGMAASMGYYILQSCHKRIMTKRSQLMLHEASLNLSGGIGDVVSALIRLKAINETLLVQYSRRMKVSEETVREKITNKEWWLGSKEGLEVGAVDRVITTFADYLRDKGCVFPE